MTSPSRRGDVRTSETSEGRPTSPARPVRRSAGRTVCDRGPAACILERLFTLSLNGKVVVVVGGTSGIGLSGARACLQAGASVVVIGLEAGCERQEWPSDFPGRVRILAADARDPQSVSGAIGLARKDFGGFHGLLHVAGGSGRGWGDGPLHEITDRGWDRTLELNLSTVFYSNRAAIGDFLQRGVAGSIVNVTSVLAFSPSPAYFATHAYAAAKAGVIGLVRAVASRYAASGIRVNALAPGLVDTPMAARALSDEETGAYVARKQPLDGGRPGLPEDLEAAVVFLLSDRSAFVTGQVLAVDGGWSVTEAGAK